MKLFKKVFVLLLALSLLAAACGGDDEGSATTTSGEAAFKACQVTDTGGVDDRSFNQTAYKGVTDAVDQLGVEGKVLESQAETDYAVNIESFISEGCDIIVTVGFLLGDATQVAAEANPDQKFAIVDYAYDPTIPNVLGLVFSTAQAAFMAGYLAASVTQTGTVGTYGGIQIPGAVTDFMDGFAWGVKYYNEQKGTDVKVIGWDPVAQTGLFTGDFESLDKGRQTTQSLIDEGADIILPVAGPVGLGTAALAQERGDILVIGVDTDQYVSAPTYASVWLSSVQKNMDVAVFNAIKAAQDGSFAGGVFVGTLENGGVGLAPFHDNDGKVSAETKAELETIRTGIIDGSITLGN